MNLPNGIDLDQYKTQAKELLKQVKAAKPESLDRLKAHHPEHPTLNQSGNLKLADIQLVVARENGFPSWTKFSHYIRFRKAVRVLDEGDLVQLETLLNEHPWLPRYRCRVGEWYEEGYFAGATLLNHVAGNPIRVPIPPNIVEITQLLISRGFDEKDAKHTIGLLLTSKQASEAGVALPLIDLLTSAGAEFDIKEPGILTMPILNAAPATAEALVQRGAKVDIQHAAARGDLELLRRLFGKPVETEVIEDALAFACIQGQREAVNFLIENGAKGDVLVTPGGQTPRTALHEAANRGYDDIVSDLLANGASAKVTEPRWGGTPAGWAEHGGHPELAEKLREVAQ